MGIAEKLGDPTWLFDFGFPVSRFDVTLSKTGLLDDLTWALGERYELPQLAALSDPAIPMRLWAAWHERGLFFQMEMPDFKATTQRPALVSSSDFDPIPRLVYRIHLNTRHAPGIQRGNSHCVLFLGSSLAPTNDQPVQPISFRIEGILRAKDQSPTIGTELECGEAARADASTIRVKVFIPAKALFGYSPIEFPDLSIHCSCQPGIVKECHFSRSSRMPVRENPSIWAHAKLID